jgi:hypothetical protein
MFENPNLGVGKVNTDGNGDASVIKQPETP